MSNNSNMENYEAVVEVPKNRTLFADKFTNEAPLRPEVVHNLQTVEQVFQHYKPSVSFLFEDNKGFTKLEELKFKSIEDFDMNGIILQSGFLKTVSNNKNNYLKIAKAINSNQILGEVLENDDKKKSLKKLVDALIADLKNNK